MSSEPVICVENLGKCYQIYDKPRDRLLQMLYRGRRQYYREFWALRDVSFTLGQGETLGIIGRNGAGKSTLLQLVCGTLHPTTGRCSVRGRVAALLELGAGFNPEFTGKENVYLSAEVMGLTYREIDDRYEDIVHFSGIGDFIDQPVKTYSSGMYVRLAFSVAIHVDPDILVVDEALSVGDGDFARKSFDRIMAMKAVGKTILFCSHALYQVEVFCDRVLWLDQGRCVMQGVPSEAVSRYNASLLTGRTGAEEVEDGADGAAADLPENEPSDMAARSPNQGKILSVTVVMDGVEGRSLRGVSGQSLLTVRLRFHVDPSLPDPSVGVVIDYETVVAAASAVSRSDGIAIRRDAFGYGGVEISFPRLPLRKGRYWVSAYLACERAVLIYEQAPRIAEFEMADDFAEPGLVALPREWQVDVGKKEQEISPAESVLLPWGHRIFTDPSDSLGLRHNAGLFEKDETLLCRRLVTPGQRILDIGANIGYYSLLFAHLTGPEGRVVAVEPDGDNFALLERNIAANGLQKIVQTQRAAFGESTGTARLYRAENGGMHRLYDSVCCDGPAEEVRVIRGDSLKLAPLDFIKIDIEGFEPFALKGLAATLDQSPEVKILCEFSPLSMLEAGASPVDFLTEMSARRFRALVFDGHAWNETPLAELVAFLGKIPADAVSELAPRLREQASAQQAWDLCNAFLNDCGYPRTVCENFLFFSQDAWPAVAGALSVPPAF